MENVDRMMIYSEFTPQLFMLPKRRESVLPESDV